MTLPAEVLLLVCEYGAVSMASKNGQVPHHHTEKFTIATKRYYKIIATKLHREKPQSYRLTV